MANARNEFIRTSDTLSSHFADFFFFEYFILRGIFFQNRGKNILFGEGNGAEFRPQKQQKKNTVYISGNCCRLLIIFANSLDPDQDNNLLVKLIDSLIDRAA